VWRRDDTDRELRRALADALAEAERLRRELTALRAVCAAALTTTTGDELARRRAERGSRAG
jgi:hypothetical protein